MSSFAPSGSPFVSSFAPSVAIGTKHVGFLNGFSSKMVAGRGSGGGDEPPLEPKISR